MSKITRVFFYLAIMFISFSVTGADKKPKLVYQDEPVKRRFADLANILSQQWSVLSNEKDYVVLTSDPFRLNFNDKFCSMIKLFVKFAESSDMAGNLLPLESRQIYSYAGSSLTCSKHSEDYFYTSFESNIARQGFQALRQIIDLINKGSIEDTKYSTNDARECLTSEYNKLTVVEASGTEINDSRIEILVGLDGCELVSQGNRLFLLVDAFVENGSYIRIRDATAWTASARQH